VARFKAYSPGKGPTSPKVFCQQNVGDIGTFGDMGTEIKFFIQK
jgi:hypothetical protein